MTLFNKLSQSGRVEEIYNILFIEKAVETANDS